MNPTAEQDLKNYIEKGVDDIIENKDDFIKKLAEVSNIKPPKASKANVEPGKTLKSINDHLKNDGHRLERDSENWPLYHLFLQSGETYDIIFKGKVAEMHDLIIAKGVEILLEFQKK